MRAFRCYIMGLRFAVEDATNQIDEFVDGFTALQFAASVPASCGPICHR